MNRDAVMDQLRGTIDYLESMVEGLNYELHVRDIRLKEKDQRIAQLEQQVQELKRQVIPSDTPPSPPPFVKPSLPRRRRRKAPGRKDGHAPALRPAPVRIDHHQDVPLTRDGQRVPLCPRCNVRLSKLRRHKRLVEDLIRSTVRTTCYHTHSGYCPHCRTRTESRAPEQPPPASLPHAQLGIHALTTAAILRVRHRLPFRQIAQLLADLPGLRVSAGGIVKQVKRLARWLDGQYQDLVRRLRASPHVHADETGWRIDGRNVWLWVMTDPTFTLYHVNDSRGSKAPRELLGESYDGTITCDFYSAYNGLNGPKQRCLTHLLRELKDLGTADTRFAATPLARKLSRWCKEALGLKRRWNELPDASYEMKASRLEDRLDQLIRDPPPEHADARRLCKRLVRRRVELTRFLWDAKLAGTNNAAERALRPAVVMRKITGGSRSQAGADAWATLASLVRTADQQGLGVYDATQKLIMEYWASARPSTSAKSSQPR